LFGLLFLGIMSPLFAGIRIEGAMTHEKEAGAGETYHGVVSIRNTTNEVRAVRLYLTDYRFFFDGRNIYGEPGKFNRSNAAWVTFSPKRVSLAPASVAEVHYSVKVPEDGALTGTYWSMLMVEEVSDPSSDPAASAKDKPRVGLNTVIRYGIQMVTHIGSSGTARLRFLKAELLKEPGKMFLQTDIENTGERWLRPALYAEVFDGRGQLMGRFPGGRYRVYPETSVRTKIDISALPKGKYKAVIIADNGDDHVFGAQFALTL